MKILVVDDEALLVKGIKFNLENEGYTVVTGTDGVEAVDAASAGDIDLIVLDLMMPRMDGLQVLQRIRAAGSAVPVLMLTAKAEIEDRVAGLEAGADDYLPKPFSTRELIARVKALSRRNESYTESVLSFNGVCLDCNRYMLVCGEDTVRLNNKEYQLAELFFRHPHCVFSSEHLMESVWGMDSSAEINVVWTTIGFVRRKLKEIGAPVEIKTVRGAGYALEEGK